LDNKPNTFGNVALAIIFLTFIVGVVDAFFDIVPGIDSIVFTGPFFAVLFITIMMRTLRKVIIDALVEAHKINMQYDFDVMDAQTEPTAKDIFNYEGIKTNG
jgi:hypothetical protein